MSDTDNVAQLRQQLAHERAERQRAEAALHDRIAFESLVTRISARFLNVSAAEMDQSINDVLAEIGMLAGVDRSYVFRLSDDTMTNTHEWCAPGISPTIEQMNKVPVAPFVWSTTQVWQGNVLHIPRVADLPPEAANERALLEQQHVKSLILVPLVAQGQVIGFLGFDSVSDEKHWSEDSIALLHVVGEIIASTWQRQRAEAALSESQRTLADLLGNLPGMAYRCRIDPYWTMEFVSEGSIALTGYAPADLIDNRRLSYGSLIHPDDYERVQQNVDEALREQRPFQITYRLLTASGEEKWVWEQGHNVTRPAEQPLVIEGFITDLSERVMVEQQLEQRVNERTRQLTTLLEISQHVTSTLDMQPLLGIILDELGKVVAYTAASIFVLDGTLLRILSYRGPIADLENFSLALEEAGTNREVIQCGEPLIISDVRDDTPLARMFQATAGDELYTTFGYIRSWMGVPLMFKERVVGMLTLDHAEPNAYTPAQARFVLAFAQQAGGAIENARLYHQTRRHAEETGALLAVQQALTSRLDPDVVLQTIADAACRLTGASFGTVFLRQGDDLCVSVLSGNYGPGMFVGYCMPVHGSATGLAMLSGSIVHITDSASDPRVNQDAMQRAGLQSLLGIPLLSGTEPIGVISVGNKQSGTFNTDDERILGMLAPGAVIALENARLYQAEHERRQEAEKRRQIAEGLRDVLTALNSNLALNTLLDTIASQAQRLLQASAVAIYRLHDDAVLRIQASTGLSAEYAAMMHLPSGAGAVGLAAQEQRPVAIRNTETFFAEQIEQYGNELTPELLALVEQMATTYCALLAVPLLVKKEIYGTIALYYSDTRQFSEDEIALAMAFADQVALAIESARFSEQAQQAAALEERQRLARDLHDAVTQTLFSASMIADVLPRLWERNPDEAQRRLAELRQLTRGALAEMRTLLLELRPSALRDANLGDVLQQLGEAVTGRARLPVTVTVTGEERLPPDVRVALYRIAQEAMHNVIKHASAQQVAVELHQTPEEVTLRICDDGRGFDAARVDGGHFGLRIMHERAEAAGAALQVASQPDHGTTITVRWPQPTPALSDQE